MQNFIYLKYFLFCPALLFPTEIFLITHSVHIVSLPAFVITNELIDISLA